MIDLPAELKRKIELDIINNETGVESVSFMADFIQVTVAPQYPLPTARVVTVGSHRIPIRYVRGTVYSLGAPALEQWMSLQAQAVVDDTNCRTCKFDTIRGGISIGHYNISAGTLGTFVFFDEDNRWGILTNNHVGANVNNAQRGDDWLQPGRVDSTERRAVAKLERFVPIRLLSNYNDIITPDKINRVDGALGRPLSTISKTRSIIDMGFPLGTREAFIGQSCKKSGRTSGTNSSSVISVDAAIQVNFGTVENPVYAAFQDLIQIGPIVLPGDSGSLLLDSAGYAIGLVFAGAFRREGEELVPVAGYACKIGNVLTALKCSMLRHAPMGQNPVGEMLPRIAAGLLTGGVGGFL